MSRILHLHNQPKIKGGAEVYLNQLHRLLPSYGYESYLLFIVEKEKSYFIIEGNTEYKKESVKEVITFLKNYIESNKIQICFIHNLFIPQIDFALSFVCRLYKLAHGPVLSCPGKDKYWRYSNKPCNKPFGLHCFYHIYSEGCSNRHPKRVINAWNYVSKCIELSKNNYEKIVVMSEWNKSTLEELNIPGEKISVNPYFTDFIPDEFVQAASEERIMFVGRVTLGKGVDELIQAYQMVLSQFENVKLEIVGDGMQLNRLKEYARDKSLNNITFHGWKTSDEIKKLMRECSIVAFPSTYPETFGIVGIEAMMLGKPVVGFDVGGVATWLKNDVNGILVEAGNVEQFANGLKKLILDKTLYRRMSNKAREIAIVDYVENTHMSKLVELLK